jgi:hypothetical protein
MYEYDPFTGEPFLLEDPFVSEPDDTLYDELPEVFGDPDGFLDDDDDEWEPLPDDEDDAEE